MLFQTLSAIAFVENWFSSVGKMLAAIHFRLCLSLVPVMLSIPFAWKVHETKILNAIHDKEVNTQHIFEELKALDETTDKRLTIGNVIETTTIEDEIMDFDGIEEDEIIRDDKFVNDVSILEEDISDLNHFLGINFGMDQEIPSLDPNSFLKHHSWVGIKMKETKKIMQLLTRRIYDFANKHVDMRYLALNVFGILALYFQRAAISACFNFGFRLLFFPFRASFRMLQSLWLYLQSNLIRKSSGKNKSKQKPSPSFDMNCTTLPRSFSNIKDPESMSPSRASFGDVCDQAAMFDEKKNSRGFEERKDTSEASEWLESSFIEGGIQTYSMVENETGRSTNKTDDYLQFSTIKNTERDITDTIMKDLPRSSTPRRLTRFTDANRTGKYDLDISTIYSPQKLRKHLHNKCEQKKGLELALGLSKLTYSQCIVVNEQKKQKNRDPRSLKLNYFVNSTKDKIRRRLMNMSYV